MFHVSIIFTLMGTDYALYFSFIYLLVKNNNLVPPWCRVLHEYSDNIIYSPASL